MDIITLVKVNWLPIIVSYEGKSQLLNIILKVVTGKYQEEAVFEALNEWSITDKEAAMCSYTMY